MEKLVVITEDADLSLRCFKEHGFYPDMIVFDSVQLGEILGYADEHMHFLLIVAGLVDLSSAEIVRMLELLASLKDIDIRVLTTFELETGAYSVDQYIFDITYFKGTLKLGSYVAKKLGKTSVSTYEFWSAYPYAFEPKEPVIGEKRKPYCQQIIPEEEIIKKSFVDVDLFR